MVPVLFESLIHSFYIYDSYLEVYSNIYSSTKMGHEAIGKFVFP
jgi:hypothetical protein